MAKLLKARSHKMGLAPGELVYVGTRQTEKFSVEVIDYNESTLKEDRFDSVDPCFKLRDSNTVSWINFDAVDHVEAIEKLGHHFKIHALVLEDIVNTGQRPKVEDHGEYLYIVLKMVYLDEETDAIEAEQVSLILGEGFVITFQERDGDVFGPVRDRIRNSKVRIRKMGADYLAYALVDMVVDHYYVVLEALGDRLEAMEEELLNAPGPDVLKRIHGAKRDLIFLRKAAWPLRELMSSLQRSESTLLTKPVLRFIDDVYDHTMQVLDTVETFRDVVTGLQDIHLANVSNKMNEVMKTLTIIATIFIPLTFIAGIYGMNFEHMPELHWKWGYISVWVVMGTTVMFMIAFFKRKHWL